MQDMQIHGANSGKGNDTLNTSICETTNFDQSDRFTTIIGFMREEKQKV